MKTQTQYLTTAQVAELRGVSERAVRQWIKSGRLPTQRFGRDHMISKSDAEKFERLPRGRRKVSP